MRIILKHAKGADLILSSTSDSWHSKIAFIASKMLRKPIAFRKQGCFRHKTFRNSIYFALTKFIEKHANAVMYPGVKQREFIISYGVKPEKLFPFPRLIKDLRKEPLDKILLEELENKYKNKLIFLYLGRVIDQKGLDLLIKSFSKLEESYKNILLMIVGGPSAGGFHKEYSSQYYDYCKELASNEAQNVVFVGDVPPSQIHNYYFFADVFVHPHRKFISNRITGEGWGNVVVEAACMGLPFVLTDRVPSAFELVKEKENGIIVNSDNLVDNLYDAMEFFLKRREHLKKMSLSSRHMYEKYNNPQRIIDSLNSIINLR